MTLRSQELTIHLPTLHLKQTEFVSSHAKRKVVRAGRRAGKTVGVADLAVECFLDGRRVLYGAPTTEQIDRFWKTVCRALHEPLDAKVFYKNETEHIVELAGTEQRIRAKTVWNSDTLRGDYCDLLILDEWQLMDETAWSEVGAPMLLDNDGDAVFVYTPPSLHSKSMSKAKDKRHAAKLFKKAQLDSTGRWAAFHFTSYDNPYISGAALAEISQDMTAFAMRQEILAEDSDDAPGALWRYTAAGPEEDKRCALDTCRVSRPPELRRIVVAIDPSITSGGDEAGIVAAGVDALKQGYVLADASRQGSPAVWAKAAVDLYRRLGADKLVAEDNQGGEMVALTIGTIPGAPPVKLIHASRGKQARAEPVAALYEHGTVKHVGEFSQLEAEMCEWEPVTGAESPNRLDALVHALTELMLGQQGWVA